MNSIGFVESLWQDLRYALRSLRRNRGFAAAAIVTLALGIGANTTVFSVVDAAMFRPLPYRDPTRLVSIVWVAARGSAEQVTYVGGASLQEIADWRAQKQIFAGVEPSSRPRAKIGPTGLLEPTAIAYISTGMLDLLGVQPTLGRGFLPEEGRPGNDLVALLSHGYWLREFGGDAAVVGKTVALDNHVYTVVGVMPRDFPFAGKPNVYVPWTEKSGGDLSFTCRIRPGLDVAQAEREAALVSDRIRYKGRVPWAKMTPEFWSYSDRLSSRLSGEIRTALLIMMGAVGLVLLIACANVANLLLSRGATLQREVAIRSAIGASRGRLVRHFLVESTVLAAAGALAALLLTWWLTNAIPTLLPADLRRLFATYELALSKRVFTFTGTVTALTCLLSGLVPAFRATHRGAIGGLIGTGRTAGVTRATRRLHVCLQSLQVGLALVLLCGAGLMANSFVRMTLTESGFDTRNLCLVRVSLPPNYPKGPERQAFYDQLLSIVKALPAVELATTATGTPATSLGFGSGRLFAEDALGASAEPWAAELCYAGPDYFSTLRIPIVAGRNFGPEDGPSSPPVAVIDHRAAEHYWPGQSALGRRLRAGSRAPWITVIGIAASVKTPAFTDPDIFQIYRPISQGDSVAGGNLIIRTVGEPGPVLAQVRAQVVSLNPGARVSTAATFDELYSAMDAKAAATPRFYLILMSIFAGVALATAAVGIYGILSYSVAQRFSEIGVRMALGATTHDIRRLVLRVVLAPVSTGIVSGVIASLWLTRLLRSLLYQIAPDDPITIISVASFLLLVSLAASYLPSRRATRIDPMAALRVE